MFKNEPLEVRSNFEMYQTWFYGLLVTICVLVNQNLINNLGAEFKYPEILFETIFFLN